MAARGWPGAPAWARRANRIAPTIVGGSKNHGGAALGPTRARRAWAELGVDGIGIADAAPGPDTDPAAVPRLTCEMVTRLQGWQDDWGWQFSGRKTARYRQIGNAFPPPVAQAVGTAIRCALEHAGAPKAAEAAGAAAGPVHDPVFRVLRSRADFLTARQIADLAVSFEGAGPVGASPPGPSGSRPAGPRSAAPRVRPRLRKFIHMLWITTSDLARARKVIHSPGPAVSRPDRRGGNIVDPNLRLTTVSIRDDGRRLGWRASAGEWACGHWEPTAVMQ